MLLLIFWVNGCREDQRKDTYKNYVEHVEDFATQSQRLGQRLNTLLTTPGTKEADVENELSGLAQQQDKLTNRLGPRSTGPPSQPARSTCSTRSTSGRRAERDVRRVQDDCGAKNADQAGAELAEQMHRFVASDVIWEDLFNQPTKDELAKLSITGVNVPDSIFFPNPDIAHARPR